MKIAFPATASDHSNPLKNRNLVGNYLIEHFRKAGVAVEIFDSHENAVFNYFFKSKKLYYKLVLRQNYLRHREPKLLRYTAHQISEKINNSDADFVFAFGSLPIAFLDVKKPIYFITDATFANLHNFYDEYKNLTEESVKNAHEIEKMAFQKSERIFFSSEWAAESCVRDYGIAESKISIVPLGANLASVPNACQIEKRFDPANLNQINLLSFGKYWLRKGHDRAIQVLEKLLSNGVNASLTIVGTDFPDNWNSINQQTRSKINIFNNLHKENSAELEILENILKKTHFMLLLSRYETFGHVICEANAYGIPVIANNIGGVASAVKNGVNGFLVDEINLIDESAAIIEDFSNNETLYRMLVKTSKAEYDNWLNWDNTVKLILENI